MSAPQFTPGPWFHDPSGDWRDICQWTGPNSCHVIATVSYSVDGDGEETDRANANLIAAAPDLYEALGDLIDRCDANQRPGGGSMVPPSARAAIAKARGEQQ